MKKIKLARGSARRAIAMASAFMMTCSTVVGNPYCGVISAFAKEVTDSTAGSEAGEDTKDTGENETEEEAGSGTADETEETEGSGTADETEEAEGSGTADETEEAEESGTSGEAEEEAGSGTAGETEKPGAGGSTDGSEEGDESEETEEDGTTDESKENDESGITGEREEKLSVQEQIQTLMLESGTWYMEIGSYLYEDGFYYVQDEVTGENKLITEQYIEVEREDGICIIHLDKDGKMSVGWLGSKDEGFRFAKGDGKVIVNKKGKEAGNYYGDFDEEGYWTPDENVFFGAELDDKTPVIKYAGDGGEVAAVGRGDERKFYCFDLEEKRCWLYAADGTAKEEVADIWVFDLRIDENGYLLTNESQKMIDGKYYDFDGEGHSRLVILSIIYDADGKIVCYVDEKGKKAANVFAFDGRYTYYFGDDGEQVFRQWIEEAGKFRYVNDKGRLVVNTQKAVGGYYGDFDAEGYWTAIENTFFEDELDDGTVVKKYAAAEGKIAGIGEKENRQYYCLVPAEGGRCYLYSADGTSREPVTDTWIEDLRINEDGYLLAGVEEVLLDGNYYIFDEDGHGKLMTNAFIHDADGNILYYVDEAGIKVTAVENRLIENRYYNFDEEGIVTLITNSFIYGAGGETVCYVDENGDKVTGVKEYPIGDLYYDFDEAGSAVLVTDSFIHDGSGNLMHYVDAEGKKITDAQQMEIEGKYYNFDEAGYVTLITNSFIYRDGEILCYVGMDGGKVTEAEEQQVGDYYYRIDAEGAVTLITNAFIHDEAGNIIHYVDADGKKVTAVSEMQIGDKYYNFDEAGYAVMIANAFLHDASGNPQYYLDENGDKVTDKKEQLIEGKYYNIGEDGLVTLIVNAFIKDESGEFSYYVGEDGMKVTGAAQKQIGDKYYNFDSEGRAQLIVNAFIHDASGNPQYYLDENGDKVTDKKMQQIEGKYYDIDADGQVTLIVNAFIRDESGQILCYVDEEGTKVTDTAEKEIEGKYYNFDADGQVTLIKNAFIHDEAGNILYYLDENGDKVTGLKEQLIEGKYYNFDENGRATLIANAFIHDEAGNILHYLDETGEIVTGVKVQLAEGKYYEIDESGYVTLIRNSLIRDELGNILCYVDADGTKVVNAAELQVEDKYYNIDGEGNVILITNAFIHDQSGYILFYLDENGDKVTDQKGLKIEGKYYDISVEGYVSLITSTLIFDADGAIVCYVDENGAMVTNRFVEVDGVTLYFGEDGAQVFHRWIEEDGRFRYVDGKGRMVVNDTRIAGGYYGHFDGSGYWTAIEDALFDTRLDNGTAVMKYAGEGGKVAGIGNLPNRQYYCFVKEANGKIHCYLSSSEDDSLTAEIIRNIWIGRLWVNEDGNLSVNVETQKIGNKYYMFDADGYSTLITNALISPDADVVYYVDEEGNVVVSQYVSIGGHTLYFGADGAQVFHQWLEEGGKFRYINGKGYMLVDTVKAAGGYYGSFDQEGYWTAIERTFFNTELDDGTPVMEYAGKEGEIAGIGKGMENRQFYCFLKGTDGMIRCRLLTAGGAAVSEEMVANVWIDDMRVNGRGYLIISADEPVDGVYYHFDENGHGTVISYQITYVLDGGINSNANPSSYTGAMDAIVLEAPSRAGYTFGGWYLDSGFTVKITEIASKSYGNLTLYAKWIKNSESSSGSDSDSSSGSSGDSNSSNTSGTVTDSAVTGGTTSVTVTVGENQNVTVQTGGTTVSATTAQTAEGSVSGNTIVSTTEKAAVTVAEGQTAEVATIAVGADGSARALLAAEVLGAAVQQKTVVVQGVEVTQNVVVYADGTQVTQKSGASELGGFAENVVSAEMAIQSGSQTVAAVYNDKVDIDLQQYQQVGTAVTYEVAAGINGAVPQVQMEQTNFAPGQEVTALITDVNGNVTAVTVVVGENGIIQYQISGVSCIVRLMCKR